MKTLIALAVALVLAIGCSGNGGYDEDDGQVVDREILSNPTVYRIELSDVVPHGTHLWWRTVTVQEFNNCQLGDLWSVNTPGGCS